MRHRADALVVGEGPAVWRAHGCVADPPEAAPFWCDGGRLRPNRRCMAKALYSWNIDESKGRAINSLVSSGAAGPDAFENHRDGLVSWYLIETGDSAGVCRA